ncbi:mannonate dehydratase [Marispirochaeta aestuarii]|uniref:mannonate dehydratase n=1 Tax=Marispirochaeta aestuarii TaxID=1963862 RepID=UPI0029C99A1F|nr:mannonate dehydratase [Marispirochaeta aestuarii]
MSMEQTWRWYGPDDPVRLSDIRQAGATGIVTSLQDIPIGDVWSLEALQERKRMIEWDDSLSPPRNRGLSWSVVESIPVHEDIKLGLPGRERYIENYKQSIRNVGAIGVKTVCYNFMPVLDWTRTDLEFELEDGSLALRFDVDAFAAFDLFILKRPGAASEYSEERQQAAWEYFEKMTQDQKENLQHNIIAGLPGGQEGYSLAQFQERLNAYRNVDDTALRSNLAYFLQQIVPVAIESDVKLAIHPDDPPYPLFGLPRIVSTEEDLRQILSVYDTVYNGFTLCTGSYGVRADNDLVHMVEKYGSKLNFAHLRSTQREPDGSFFEAAHLQGNVDMFRVMRAILKEEKLRIALGRRDPQIPMRADHGHTILDDLDKKTNPGYSAIGLLRGMAELRGLELGIERSGAA